MEKRKALRLIAPFLCWLFLFYPPLLGKTAIGTETFATYGAIKYYLDNLRNGIYPLWNPFSFWGSPTRIDLMQIGQFNPFVLAMIPLNALGVDFYHAFLVFLVFYYFMGLLGFYCLSRLIFKDELFAIIAYCLLLFSSLGFTLLSNVTLLLLFVPAVWFFYFWFDFFQEARPSNFSGMIFSLMQILTTYLPFYFLITFASFFLLFCLVYGSRIKYYSGQVLRFIRLHTAVFCLGLITLGVALFPAALAYREAISAEIVNPSRHSQSAEVYSRNIQLDYSAASASSLSARMSLADLYSGFKENSNG